MVREIIAVKSGQKKGFKSTDEFKTLSQGVPSEGNSFSLVAPSFRDTITKVQQETMSSAKLNTDALKKFDQLIQGNFNSGAYSVGVNGRMAGSPSATAPARAQRC